MLSNSEGRSISDHKPEPAVRRSLEGFRWEGVSHRPYKEAESAPFKAISRQTLFSDPRLLGELRYFEIEPGGFSTLERHEHMHAVMVLRGEGACLVGGTIRTLRLHDLVTIAPWTWHQFRAGDKERLGFLCLVNAERDRPQLPSDEDLEALTANPEIAAFLRR
ncbi:cupin domain-containing protein [Methylocella tundrae]|uniref:Cupin 2 conserved barrel domain protein n=1 Tax=Methylocella tundrae TaxID=227605 RepID=A0A4U8YZQ1_METTU|nr:cupin domain-containing protein [Methylocella tundrae]WPP05122.1 cupin domain-containing protein [Methylocella tundrae]VFU07445.1 Cupin 2 conserved barrel domain protein [Methylocella tundrae]